MTIGDSPLGPTNADCPIWQPSMRVFLFIDSAITYFLLSFSCLVVMHVYCSLHAIVDFYSTQALSCEHPKPTHHNASLHLHQRSLLHPDALESDLLVKLSASCALEDLQENLLSSLHRLGWTEKVTALATELLRAGRCETFDDVMAAVLASAEGRSHPALGPNVANGESTNGTKETNGIKKGNKAKDHSYDPLKYIEEIDIRIPETVVDEGVRGLKDIIREVADLEGESAPNGDKK
ncbi:unnamed protein product [Penicillium nalgiovense]|nr:unnamed protein product [Penicillium nalgiovense]